MHHKSASSLSSKYAGLRVATASVNFLLCLFCGNEFKQISRQFILMSFKLLKRHKIDHDTAWFIKKHRRLSYEFS